MRALSGSCSPWRSDFALEMEIEDLAVVERRRTWRIEDDIFFSKGFWRFEAKANGGTGTGTGRRTSSECGRGFWGFFASTLGGRF